MKLRSNPQGRRWQRLDNTGKLFPLIANENLSNVFRVSVTLKEDVDPELLKLALTEILPWFPGFRVKLKRGFFWYYFESNRRTPVVEEEAGYPCRYIDPKSNELFLFRVTYYKKRIHFEIFHGLSDGLGAVNFLRELTYRYLQLKTGHEDARPSADCLTETEDSYLKNYKKTKKKSYSSRPAYRIEGKPLRQGAENILHGTVSVAALKKAAKSRQVTITKYLTAVLLWSIYEEYFYEPGAAGQGGSQGAGGDNVRSISQGAGGDTGRRTRRRFRRIEVNLPINLRAFFGSTTTSNFFAVTGIAIEPAEGENVTFTQVLQAVCTQMDENIVKEKLEETISYNVSREKKWYVRIVPLCIKWLALGPIFRRNDRAHTITLSNLGGVTLEEPYRSMVEDFRVILGVSWQQPAKVGVCSFGDRMVISFATIFDDSRLSDRFFGQLRADGIASELESNGAAAVSRVYDQKNYPQIGYAPDQWKRMMHMFYGTLGAVAVILALVNIATFQKLWWAGIAVPGVIYTGLTVRYSILRHSNLGKSLMIQTLGAGVLLYLIDQVLGYEGWSVNYGIPSLIMFADIAVVFLILVNRMNWQSYFMYQIAVTVLSLFPLILWAFGWITRPLFAIITVVLTLTVLLFTIILGDRSVKHELIRRFHL